MKPIIEFNNYKSYIQSLILCSQKEKSEVYYELSCSLGVPVAQLKSIFEGEKHISEDSLLLVCIYFGLGDLESRYLSVLLRLNQAINWQEIDSLCGQLDLLKQEMIDLRLEQTTEISMVSEIFDCA